MTTAQTLDPPIPSRTTRDTVDHSLVFLIAAIALVTALQLWLVWIKSINWDEFYHFSEIHARLAGEPVDVLQTPYSYLFGFVTEWPGSAIDHIRYTRLLILPFEAVLIASIVIAARRFAPQGPALAAGLLYLTAGFAFTQALSLRADIIAASMVMAAVAIGLHRPLRPLTLGVIAVLCALAFVSTIKTLLYAPVLLGVLVVRREALRAAWPLLGALALVAGAVAVVVSVIYPEIAAYLVDKLGRAAVRMFGGEILPQGRYLLRQLGLALPFALAFAGFLPWLVQRSGVPREDKAALVLFVLPAFWPLVYFNAYPYFYAFILPPVAVGLSPVIAIALQRYGVGAVALACILNAAVLLALEPRGQLAMQQAFDAQVREIFPHPVRYIDESGIIGDYPRAVPHYASGWALAKYRKAGVAEYRSSVLGEPVPLLIANSAALAHVFSPRGAPDRLLPEDEAFLRANYLPHAGMIHVAGKRLAAGEHRPAAFIPTPGTYRIEGGRVRIDNLVLSPGASVTLTRGRHDLANLSAGPVTLRWAEAGEPRTSSITLRDLYTDF